MCYPRPVRYNIFYLGVRVGISELLTVTFLCLNFKPQRPVLSVAFFRLPKKGSPGLELTSRYWKNSDAFSFEIIPTLPLPCVQRLLLDNMQIRDAEPSKMAAYLLLLVTEDFCLIAG